MILSRVVGDVVATHKHDKLRGNRLLLVEPIDLEGEPMGPEFIALDNVGAGAGDRVLVCKEGGSAGIALGIDKVPLQTVVVAIVDRLEVHAAAAAELGVDAEVS